MAKKKVKQFVMTVTVNQQFSTNLGVEAFSEEEAKKKVKDMVKDCKINKQWFAGSLADDNVSDYWTPEGTVVVTDVTVKDEYLD